MYGWRGRIGLIFPSRGDTFVYEFYKMLPEGFIATPAINRVRAMVPEHLGAAFDAYLECAEDLAPEVDVIIATGTPVFTLVGSEREAELLAEIRRRVPVPFIVGARAEAEALTHLGIRRLVIATPFEEEITQRERRFLESQGFEVLSARGLGIRRNVDIGLVANEASYRLARELLAAHLEADGVFIPCPRWPVSVNLEALERDTGKPAVGSVQALLWKALRTLGYRQPILGYGRLMASLAD
ncbi:MAG: maleate cis-trans isomerase [Deltaproteobacteria bacterium]|nr:maleate cis-trans isomerase [Deltaproteobacteria bacterium]